MKKKLGVIGGMGPLATSIFYKRLIDLTDAECDQDHLDVCIMSHASMPDRTDVILNGKSPLEIIGALETIIKAFEAYGVERIAIPCNTFHYFADEISKLTDIKLINMIDSALEKAEKKFGENAGIALLATDGTIQAGVYDRYAEKRNITLIKPDKASQTEIMKVIYSVKAGASTKQKSIDNIIRNLIEERGADGVILACTELSCLDIDGDLHRFTVDAMECLADNCVSECKGD